MLHGVAMRLQQAPYESRSLRHVRYDDGRAQVVFTFLRKTQCWAEQRCGKVPCRVDSLGLGHWKEMSQRGLLVKYTGQKPGCAAFCRTGVFSLFNYDFISTLPRSQKDWRRKPFLLSLIFSLLLLTAHLHDCCHLQLCRPETHGPRHQVLISCRNFPFSNSEALTTQPTMLRLPC